MKHKINKILFILTITCTLLISFTQIATAQSSIFRRKTEWTVPEVKEWSEKNKEQLWHGWLLYQGSDTTTHYFVSRFMDEWVIFKIKRSEILIKDIKSHRKVSSSPLGYYYVDPLNDFIKTKEYITRTE